MSKVWFVTGASRGLGRSLSQAVLAAGDKLVATARNPDDLRELVAAHADCAIVVALDVTSADAARAAIAAGVTRFGRLDVVVNNAGYSNVSAVEDVDEADFRAQMETNFYGAFHVTRAALPVLRAQKSGHLVQVSTIGARLGSPGFGAYQAAKWALEGFSEVVAREVAGFGIHVTLVEPGGFRTDFATSSLKIGEPSAPYAELLGAVAHAVRHGDMSQRGDPAKAAQAILQLAAMSAPPLRLLLGSDAFAIARSITDQRKVEDGENRALTLSTDFEGIEAFEKTAAGKMFIRSSEP